MTILFDSQMYPDELVQHFERNAKGTLDYAAHNLSKAIYFGLKENGQHVRLINIPNIGSFPVLYKKILVKGGKMDDGECLQFYNIPVLKRKSICRVAYRKIKKEFELLPKGEDIVFLMYNAKLLTIVPKLKKLRPSLKVCMIVTDLPEYMVTPNLLPYRLADALNFRKADFNEDAYSYVDGYVLLAPRMSERLPIKGRPWIQMEGIYDSTTEVEKVEKSKFKAILYTGNLSKRYGILDLLDAFAEINSPDYRLWIRGNGDCKEEVLLRSQRDSRIEYLPPLSRDKLLKLQKKATLLVNPVKPSEEFTSFFFPSKTLEYMASGTPVAMYHLDCIPKEYDEYLYYIEDKKEGLLSSILSITNKDQSQLNQFGARAAQFIYANKTPSHQMAKVIYFIKTLYS